MFATIRIAAVFVALVSTVAVAQDRAVGTFSPCIGCDDAVRPAMGKLVKPWEPPANKCSKFNAGSVFAPHWAEVDVDVSNPAMNWLSHHGYPTLHHASVGSGGHQIAQNFIAHYCANKPDPAGFPYRLKAGRSCTLKTGWDFQGNPKVFAHYQGCHDKSTAALPGKPVMIYAQKPVLEPVKPGVFDPVGSGGFVESGTGSATTRAYITDPDHDDDEDEVRKKSER